MSKQKLIDIMFEVALTIHNDYRFSSWSNEEVVEWIRSQLKQTGYEVTPVGSSHGVLIKEKENE